VPDGEWFCVECESEPGAGVGVYKAAKTKGKAQKKTHAKKDKEVKEDSPAPQDDDIGTGEKRKAPPKGKASGMYSSPSPLSLRRLISCLRVGVKKKKQ
jgi:hypothetical protein